MTGVDPSSEFGTCPATLWAEMRDAATAVLTNKPKGTYPTITGIIALAPDLIAMGVRERTGRRARRTPLLRCGRFVVSLSLELTDLARQVLVPGGCESDVAHGAVHGIP